MTASQKLHPFINLCTALEWEVAERPVSEQLRVVSDVIVQLSEIYAARVEILLCEWERRFNPIEPIVDVDGCVELFVQSLHLDVAELFEPPEVVLQKVVEGRKLLEDCASCRVE